MKKRITLANQNHKFNQYMMKKARYNRIRVNSKTMNYSYISKYSSKIHLNISRGCEAC
jgi:hypothetical protein